MSDTQETGPQTIDQLLDAKYSEPEEAPTEEVIEAPAPDAEHEEAPAEVAEAEEEEIDETTDPEPASEEPQHLTLDEYGDVTIPVIVDGEEKRVNLSEAAKGYQLQADYSRKTAALSVERRDMETTLQQERAAIQQEYAGLADKQRLLDEQLAQSIEPEPDWVELAKKNPLQLPVEKEKWNLRQQQRQSAQARMQQGNAQRVQEFQRKTAELAVTAFPEWQNEGEFVKNANQRREVALAIGFTPEEYDGSNDFRLAALLEKAARFDAMQNQNAVIEKKLAKAPKVLRPGKVKAKADVHAEQRATTNRKLDQPHSMESHLNAYMDRQAG